MGCAITPETCVIGGPGWTPICVMLPMPPMFVIVGMFGGPDGFGPTKLPMCVSCGDGCANMPCEC